MHYWHLYWVASDGIEDCFVIAKNSRSAGRIECGMNGFEQNDLRITRILRIPKEVELHFQKQAEKNGKKLNWPWYAYRDLLEKVGAEFREIDDTTEMLLENTVYRVYEDQFVRARDIGSKAVMNLYNNPIYKEIEYDDDDGWDSSQAQLLSLLGMCVARCQQIEYLIANSFMLGLSKKQKRKYKTIKDLIEGWKKKSLGNMLKSIEEAYDIDPEIRSALYLFKDMRNDLIHSISIKERYNINTYWGQQELVSFLSIFDAISLLIKKAFKSSYYASIHFAMTTLDQDKQVPDDLLDEIDNKDLSIFIHFFRPKYDCM